jgi:predicted short-subunit dehydrogenase-like oxidoreductase (DUF2520 family)
VVLLGAGRLGGALRLALDAAGVEVTAHWTRSKATAAAARTEGLEVVEGPLPDAIRSADLVCLAVSDRALSSLAGELASSGLVRPAGTVVHHSGATDLSPLAALRSTAHVGSLHPLVSVASRRTVLASVACAIEASDDETVRHLDGLARRISLKPLRWQGDRARYHAAACLVGNFPQALMAAAVRLLEEAGVDAQTAREALGPLLLSAARNAADHGGAAAFSGPVARGDVEVVRRHLAALDAPGMADVAGLYRSATQVAAAAVGGPHRGAFVSLLEDGS